MASHMAYLPFVSSPVATKRITSPTTAMVWPWVGVRRTGCLLILPSLPFAWAGRSSHVSAPQVCHSGRAPGGPRSSSPSSAEIRWKRSMSVGADGGSSGDTVRNRRTSSGDTVRNRRNQR